MTKLSLEAFPAELNSRIKNLMLMNKYDIMWFEVTLEQRVAILKANFFVGENLGQAIYKVGFLCLMGIAHLTEEMGRYKLYRSFEVKPVLSTDID